MPQQTCIQRFFLFLESEFENQIFYSAVLKKNENSRFVCQNIRNILMVKYLIKTASFILNFEKMACV